MASQSGRYTQESLEGLFLHAPFFLQGTPGATLSVSGIFIESDETIPMVASVKLTVEQGVVTLAATERLTFVRGDGTLDAAMQFSGKIEAVNHALSCLLYRPKEEGDNEDILSLEVTITSTKGKTRGVESRKIPIHFNESHSPQEAMQRQGSTSALLVEQHLDESTQLALVHASNTLLEGKKDPKGRQLDVMMTSFSPSFGQEAQVSSKALEEVIFLGKEEDRFFDLTKLDSSRLAGESSEKEIRQFPKAARHQRGSLSAQKSWIEGLGKEIREGIGKQGWNVVEEKRIRESENPKIAYIANHPSFPEASLFLLEGSQGVIFCNPFVINKISTFSLGFDVLKRLAIKGRRVLVGGENLEGERSAALIAAHGGTYVLRVRPSTIFYPDLVASFKKSTEGEASSWRLFMGSSWLTIKVSTVHGDSRLGGFIHNLHDISWLAKVEISQEVAGKSIYFSDYYVLNDRSLSASSLARIFSGLVSGGMVDSEWVIYIS